MNLKLLFQARIIALMILLTFSTSAFAQSGNVTLGEASTAKTGTSGTSPISSNTKFARHQTIYTKAEIQALGGAAGLITSLGWKVEVATSFYSDFTIKIGHTTATSLSSHNNAPTTLVYSATALNFTSGFNMLNFTSTFNWNGNDNILVDVCYSRASANNGTNAGSVFKYTAPSPATRYRNSTGTTSVCGMDTQYAGFGDKPVIRFVMNTEPICNAPANLTSTAVTTTGATISWNAAIPNPALGYETVYSTSATAPTSAGTSTTSISRVLTGLTPATTYYYWVRSKCSTTLFSSWIGAQFTTQCVAPAIAISPETAVICAGQIQSLTAETASTNVKWSPTTNLFTDSAATVAYVAGTNASTVYVKSASAASVNYIATTSNSSGCEATATVTVTVNFTDAPTAAAAQTFCVNATIADLVATGTNVLWFNSMSEATPFESDIPLLSQTYYAGQTINGCQSLRTPVVVSITPTLETIGAISGPSVLVEGTTTATYSVEEVPGATSYVWTLPAGITSSDATGSSITVDIDSAYVTGEISVKAINSCSQTTTSTLVVTVDQTSGIPTTTLDAASCGATNVSPSEQIRVTDVIGASGYRFNIYDAAGTTLISTLDSDIGFFRLSQFDFVYSATYQVKVQVKQGNVYGSEGAACSITVTNLPVVTLGSDCGAVNVTPSQQVRANGALNASGYRFNIYDATGSTLVATITNQYAFFRFTQLDFVYGTTYQVKVQVKQGNVFGAEGAACNVTVMNIPVVTLAATFCGATNVTPTQQVRANGAIDATGYRFNIYDATDTMLLFTIDNQFAFFRFNQVNFTNARTYQVRVQVKQGNVYGAEGASCSVTLADPTITPREPVVELLRTSNPAATNFKVVASPNPFSDTFALNVTEGSAENAEVRVYDMIGKLLEVRSVQSGDISSQRLGNSFPSGVYNVVVTQGDAVRTLKVIKR